METIGLLVILIIALIYVYKHVRRTVTIGEDSIDCANCPVDKLTKKQK